VQTGVASGAGVARTGRGMGVGFTILPLLHTRDSALYMVPLQQPSVSKL
jgi:hypothetical protein